MRNHTSPACVLVSGGLDSSVLLHHILAQGIRVTPLYLRCGLTWEAAELDWLRRFLRAIRSPRLASLQIVEMPLRSLYGAHWSLTGRRVPSAASPDEAVYLPGRNILLLSHAAVVCARRHISSIALGVLKGNPFGDASPRVLAQLAGCLTKALRHPITILTPLRRLGKTELIRRASSLPLELTFSCMKPRGLRHCGRCNKCGERMRAFRAAGIEDPTRYAA